MKFFSFSGTVVLFAVFAAVRSSAIPRDGKLIPWAVAYLFGVYKFPFHIVEEVDCLLKRADTGTGPAPVPPLALCL